MADDGLFEIVNDLLSSDSDEETLKHGGSRFGCCPNVERGLHEGAERLRLDYFCAEPVYDEIAFARRFRISRTRFEIIFEQLKSDPFFQQRRDCTGKLVLSGLQKVAAALRILAYGSTTDSVDEYIRIEASTVYACLRHFVNGVLLHFGELYLYAPTEPWQSQYDGKEGTPTIALEANADHNMWIWHCFFGMPGVANDINVLNNSPLLANIANGSYPPPVTYSIFGHQRHILYWLVD
eukprot:IDg1712t1